MCIYYMYTWQHAKFQAIFFFKLNKEGCYIGSIATYIHIHTYIYVDIDYFFFWGGGVRNKKNPNLTQVTIISNSNDM